MSNKLYTEISSRKQSSLNYFLMKLVDMEIGKWFYANQLDDLRKAFDQAKAMHKEEIISFAKKCLDKALDLDVRTAHSKLEEMYAETFGGDDE